MREDYGNISLVTGDDGFGDMGFDAGEPPELMRDANALEPSLENAVRRGEETGGEGLGAVSRRRPISDQANFTLKAEVVVIGVR